MTNKQALDPYKEIFRKNQGILRHSEAVKLGIPKHIIYQMLSNGDLVRETRGLYRLADLEPLGNPDLVQVSLLMPKSIIFLISALYIHNLTTQIPHQVYIALPQGTKERKIDYPPIRVYHLSDKVYTSGIEEQTFDGIKIKIYSKEKTVTDCFKFREQIGKDVALEALKDYMKLPSPDVRSIMKYAKINRVDEIIRPYIETLI
jgi:predicted transcriptional regulator of viral defense system